MSFSNETTVKAVRKRHRCDGCRAHIEVGSPAIRWAGMTDGDFGTAIYHLDCRAAEIAYNDLCGTHWADEWQGLSDIDDEDWPWLRETYPAIADRMGILPTSSEPGDRDEVVGEGPAHADRPSPSQGTDHVR